MAQDKGFPPLSRTVEVQIDVVDRANNPPVWDHTVYGPIYIRENLPVGAKVVSVKARCVELFGTGTARSPHLHARCGRRRTATPPRGACGSRGRSAGPAFLCSNINRYMFDVWNKIGSPDEWTPCRVKFLSCRMRSHTNIIGCRVVHGPGAGLFWSDEIEVLARAGYLVRRVQLQLPFASHLVIWIRFYCQCPWIICIVMAHADCRSQACI